MSDVAAASARPTRKIVANQPSAGLPQATAAPAPAPVKPVQPLRQVQQKKFPPSAIKPLGYGDSDIMTVTAPIGMTFEEAVAPAAWNSAAATVAKDPLNTRNLRDGVGTLIYLDSPDGYFAILRINGVVRDKMNNPCGLNVVCIGPSVDVKTGEARPIDVRTRKAWVDPVKTEG